MIELAFNFVSYSFVIFGTVFILIIWAALLCALLEGLIWVLNRLKGGRDE